MTFDYWTAIATSQQIKGCNPVPEMLAAMQALAVERSKQRSEALAAERAAKRSAALDALALNDADDVAAGSVATASARVAMAREAAPEPVSVEPGHWGMHA